MKISVFGLGYVGTVCAACLAERGHTVIGVDSTEVKVNLIKSGRSPIIERDIGEIVQKMVEAGRLTATMNSSEAIAQSDLSIICVGTPSRANGALGLEAMEKVTTEIGEAILAKNKASPSKTPHVVTVRSTVLPHTTRKIIAPWLAKAAGDAPFGLAFNPEFLRESSAVADFNNPSRTVVGALDDETAATMMSLYADLPGPKIVTDLETAELVKYADNAWHALKVTFGNEIGLVAKTLGIDSHKVMDIFIEDKRLNISPAYLRPGFAYGGSCLPKDLRALTYLAKQLDLSLPVISHIQDSNRMLVDRGAEWILNQNVKRIGFLGISFKSGTDDVRESSFVDIVERLLGKGREVRIYDPNVELAHLVGANKDYLMKVLPHIAELLVPDVNDVVGWAETIVATTPDPAYRESIAKKRPEQTVLDFAGFKSAGEGVKIEGFLW